MPEPESAEWTQALSRTQTDPTQPALCFQPIVDMARGVIAGYEALSRFAGPPKASPDRWFAAADRHGCGVELELRAIQRALEARATLPADTFLTINVTPAALLHPSALSLIEQLSALKRVVFEVTEHAKVTDYTALRGAADRVRAAGGLLAVDDAGSGYASLKHVLELRPDFVKLDRELISGVDTDPTKRSMVHMLGELTDRIDAWLIAEGVETRGELDVLLELEVPLGQGWALGYPAAPWSSLEPSLVEHLSLRHSELQQQDRVVALIERRPALPHDSSLATAALWFAREPGMGVAVQLTVDARPAALISRSDVEAGRWAPRPLLSVDPDASIMQVARRAMNRELACRFDPVVCRLPSGIYAGMVTLERLVEWLARDR